MCVCVLSKGEDMWIHEEALSGWFVSLYCYKTTFWNEATTVDILQNISV